MRAKPWASRLVRGHEAAAAARMTGGWTHGGFPSLSAWGGSCVLRVCWHDSGGWPGYTPERGEGDWLATTRWGAAWPITIRSAHGECADRLQAGATHTGRFYGPAGSACGLAGVGQEPGADLGVRARWVWQDDPARAVVPGPGRRLVRLGHARQGGFRPGSFLDLSDLCDRRD